MICKKNLTAISASSSFSESMLIAAIISDTNNFLLLAALSCL